MDLEIREFRENLIRYINSVDISMEIKRLVVKEVYDQIDKCASDVLKSQIAAREQAEQEQKSEVREDAESIQSD